MSQKMYPNFPHDFNERKARRLDADVEEYLDGERETLRELQSHVDAERVNIAMEQERGKNAGGGAQNPVFPLFGSEEEFRKFEVMLDMAKPKLEHVEKWHGDLRRRLRRLADGMLPQLTADGPEFRESPAVGSQKGERVLRKRKIYEQPHCFLELRRKGQQSGN